MHASSTQIQYVVRFRTSDTPTTTHNIWFINPFLPSCRRFRSPQPCPRLLFVKHVRGVVLHGTCLPWQPVAALYFRPSFRYQRGRLVLSLFPLRAWNCIVVLSLIRTRAIVVAKYTPIRLPGTRFPETIGFVLILKQLQELDTPSGYHNLNQEWENFF